MWKILLSEKIMGKKSTHIDKLRLGRLSMQVYNTITETKYTLYNDGAKRSWEYELEMEFTINEWVHTTQCSA